VTLTQGDLTKAQEEQLADAKAWVKIQQDALEEVGPVVRKFAEHKDRSKLSRREEQIIARHLRWGDADYEAFVEGDNIEGRVERFLATPMAYFYIDKGNTRYQVIVKHGEQTKIVDQDHDDFF
jgi:hypothetical protein